MILLLWKLKSTAGNSEARRLSPEKRIPIAPTHNQGSPYFQRLLKQYAFRVLTLRPYCSIKWFCFKAFSSHSRVIPFILLGVISFSDHRCNPCPKMWQWYQNSCYYFTTNEEKTWTNSRKDCIDKNSTLVKIDSLEEKVGLSLFL